MKYFDIINIDKEILNGTPVFDGTRVPIQSLFWHLEKGISIDEFLNSFPSVRRAQVEKLLQLIEQIFIPQNIEKVYETVA